MGKHEIDDLVYSKAREIVYEEVKWTATENTFRSRITEKGDSKFSDCLADAITDSTIGSLIGVPEKDRQGILDIAQRRNYFTDNEESLIERLANHPAPLDVPTIGKYLTTLRLVACGMTEIDDSLRQLKNLQVLNLSRNKISKLSSHSLPRKLRFLEMYMNEVEDVRPLSSFLPKQLNHVGLSRNKLTDSSGLESLSINRKTNLRSLDLGNNNIKDLKNLLSGLSTLPLSNLQLQGNPCSMCPSYVHEVVSCFPKLFYLDGAKPSVTQPQADSQGGLVFRCYGLTGLEETDSMYHVEFDIPLFDPVRRLSVIKALLNENDSDDGTMWFPSDEVHWSEMVDFPEVIVRVPYFADLTELRDIFRSTVTVRIVRTTPPTTEVISEFDVDLESIPWWVTSLNYKWMDGSRKAVRICHERNVSTNFGKVSTGDSFHDDERDEEFMLFAEVGLSCHVSFGVEGFNV